MCSCSLTSLQQIRYPSHHHSNQHHQHHNHLHQYQLYAFIFVLVLLQCINNGAAIKCYVCDSSDNPSCANIKSNSSIVPEECTLDKIKSLDTWLFELNKFAYFDMGYNKHPLMNCQKVTAREPHTNKMVTARFCQLDTADSDACSILHTKLRKLSMESYNTYDNNNNDGLYRNEENNKVDDDEQFHCSICKTDCCNSAVHLHTGVDNVVLLRVVLSTFGAFFIHRFSDGVRRVLW